VAFGREVRSKDEVSEKDPEEETEETGMLEALLSNIETYVHQAPLMAYLAVYVGGLMVSFTPCIYPVIPITVAYIGGKGHSRGHGFTLSLVYVLGTAATYTVLGGLAALTGSFFGAIQASPWTAFIIANVCIVLGLSMLGVFNIPSLPYLNRLQPSDRRGGYAGGFFMGVVSGLILGPCTAPVLGVILSYVATKQNIGFGMSLLFVFALGMGSMLIILGTFTGLLKNLPKAGPWMVWVQKVFGAVFIIMGEYFLFTAGQLSV
jgi:thiol:disulfide interchange protein DsbD